MLALLARVIEFLVRLLKFHDFDRQMHAGTIVHEICVMAMWTALLTPASEWLLLGSVFLYLPHSMVL